MVAVGSKSIPEKQSISIGLSKNSEDKLEKELFSEIFSSQGEITDNIGTNKENKSTNDPKIESNLINGVEFKGNEIKTKIIKSSDVKDNTPSIIDENFISDDNYMSNNMILNLKSSEIKVDEAVFETGVPAEVKIISDNNQIPDDLGVIPSILVSTKIVSQQNEDITEDNELENKDQVENLDNNNGLYVNPVPNKLTNNRENFNDKRIKGKSNNSEHQPALNNVKISLSDNFSKEAQNTSFKNDLNFEKNIMNNNKEINFNNEKDNFNDIKINKEDYSKIKKDNCIIKENKFEDVKDIAKNSFTANTENFFKTKYINTSNIYSAQGKNNINNNQNNITNASLEISNFTQMNNTSGGNSNNQNGTQLQSSINNFQLLNDIKENLDMSDKRWANNLVSRLSKAHTSKINELEIVLTPKNLGKMKIKISVSDKTAFVKITTDNASASSLIKDEQHELSEMLKEIGLELEDFSSEQSFDQNFHDDKEQKQRNTEKTLEKHKLDDESDKENYIKDESILNIKV